MEDKLKILTQKNHWKKTSRVETSRRGHLGLGDFIDAFKLCSKWSLWQHVWKNDIPHFCFFLTKNEKLIPWYLNLISLKSSKSKATVEQTCVFLHVLLPRKNNNKETLLIAAIQQSCWVMKLIMFCDGGNSPFLCEGALLHDRWMLERQYIVLFHLCHCIFILTAPKLFIFFKQSILIIWFAPWHF